MKRPLWILAATAAALLLMLGVYHATRPVSALPSAEETQAQLEDLGVRFSAAIENRRDVTPILEQVRPLVAQSPRLRDGRTLLGQLYAHLGRNADAYAQFAAALELDPIDPPLQNLAGTAALLAGDLLAAETHHRLAVQQAPDRPRLLLSLADVYLKTQRWDLARNMLLRALELELTLHEANAALSDVYAGRGQPGDAVLAIQQMEKALAQLPIRDETLPQRVTYARKLARRYADRDDPMEAVAVLDSLPPAHRFSSDVLAEVAAYLHANRQTALAGLQYELALDHRPRDPELAALAARWYARGGDAPAARAMLERLESLHPRHPAIPEIHQLLDHAPASDPADPADPAP
ncbi:MAG: tetratricopeptide repeat protein [Planctomycetota bacterium]